MFADVLECLKDHTVCALTVAEIQATYAGVMLEIYADSVLVVCAHKAAKAVMQFVHQQLVAIAVMLQLDFVIH
jgi:hypothetical protein